MGGSRGWNSGGEDAPYLPERYRQQVIAKKRRRIIRKIIAVCCSIAVIAVIFLFFFGSPISHLQVSLVEIPAISESPAAVITPAAPMNITPRVTPVIILGSGMPAAPDPGLLPLSRAVDLLHLEFPAEKFVISDVNLTESGGMKLYEFVIIPKAGSGRQDRITANIDAMSGSPYTPGQESAKISAEQAILRVGTFFSPQKADQVRARYNRNHGVRPSWDFVFVKENSAVLSGSLDPETGTITSFSRNISLSGRPKDPILSQQAAQKIAEQTMSRWNGELPVSLGSSRYEPAGEDGSSGAGRYVFEYNRIVQDMPCDEDGILLAVDSATGDTTEYVRQWNDPDNAFSVTSEILVTKREATFALLRNISDIAPESVGSVQILSAQLRWKDRHTSALTPRPGTIPVAWKVIFDDAAIRAQQPSVPATGWVDAQTGRILSLEYRN